MNKEQAGRLQLLRNLAQQLPSSVPVGERRQPIYTNFKNFFYQGSAWELVNRKLDTVFGSATILPDGHLKNLSRGANGLDTVIKYFESVLQDENDVPIDLLFLKVERLIEACELEIQLSVSC